MIRCALCAAQSVTGMRSGHVRVTSGVLGRRGGGTCDAMRHQLLIESIRALAQAGEGASAAPLVFRQRRHPGPPPT